MVGGKEERNAVSGGGREGGRIDAEEETDFNLPYQSYHQVKGDSEFAPESDAYEEPMQARLRFQVIYAVGMKGRAGGGKGILTLTLLEIGHLHRGQIFLG